MPWLVSLLAVLAALGILIVDVPKGAARLEVQLDQSICTSETGAGL
jgi:hypothetical protein